MRFHVAGPKPPAQAAEPGPNAGLRAQAGAAAHGSISELRKSELANCRAESVTLGEGGIQAC